MKPLYSYPQILTLVINIIQQVIDGFQHVTNTLAAVDNRAPGYYLVFRSCLTGMAQRCIPTK